MQWLPGLGRTIAAAVVLALTRKANPECIISPLLKSAIFRCFVCTTHTLDHPQTFTVSLFGLHVPAQELAGSPENFCKKNILLGVAILAEFCT
jgi:hypothetical protein